MWQLQMDLGSVGEPSSLQRMRRLLAERLSPELRREAAEDPVTGALNGRGDRIATTRALAERTPGRRLIRMHADLDNFKAVNDVHGHRAGDAALWLVRAALEDATRDVDVISLARPGGDEFALTLRVAVDADADAIRDRIEETVNHALTEAGLGSVAGKEIGISVGIAGVTGVTTLEALDVAADAAARERKRVRGVSQPRQTPIVLHRHRTRRSA